MIDFGSVDNSTTTKVLKALAANLRPGEIAPVEIAPVRHYSLETSTCEHCGRNIARESPGIAWKHLSSLKEECHPRPTASPKRDAAGNAIPLTGK